MSTFLDRTIRSTVLYYNRQNLKAHKPLFTIQSMFSSIWSIYISLYFQENRYMFSRILFLFWLRTLRKHVKDNSWFIRVALCLQQRNCLICSQHQTLPAWCLWIKQRGGPPALLVALKSRLWTPLPTNYECNISSRCVKNCLMAIVYHSFDSFRFVQE